MKMKKISTEKQLHSIDVHVGQRIVLRRRTLHMTQSYLAQKLGITFQQVQKYEKGSNRISASRLWDISNILGVSIDFFYSELQMTPENTNKTVANKSNTFFDPMLQEETLKLVNSYYRIKNRTIARNLLKLIQQLSVHNKKFHEN